MSGLLKKYIMIYYNLFFKSKRGVGLEIINNHGRPRISDELVFCETVPQTRMEILLREKQTLLETELSFMLNRRKATKAKRWDLRLQDQAGEVKLF